MNLMKKNSYILILITAILFLPQASSSQTNLLTNGSFETGDFTSWTTTNTQTTTYCTSWSVRTAGTTCNQSASAPQDGNFGVLAGFDGRGGTMSLYQDIAIPSLMSTRLTFTYRINWNIPAAGNQARQFEVQIRDTSNNVLETVHTFIANSGVPNRTSGVRTEQLNISQYIGQTIRLTFLNTIPQAFTGPGQFEIDNIIVESFAPTAAGAVAAGKVQTEHGYGIRGAIVSFVDSQGVTRSTRTNQFGHFRFTGVEVGNTYVFQVSHRRHRFVNGTQVINLQNARKDITFTSESLYKGKRKDVITKPNLE